jgi:hypothetical protein
MQVDSTETPDADCATPSHAVAADDSRALHAAVLDVEQRPGHTHVVEVFVRDADGSFFTPERPSFHLIVAC